MDETFHGFLTSISKEMGASVSLFDIPTLFNRRNQQRIISLDTYIPGRLPVHTLCDYEPTSTLFFLDLFSSYIGYYPLCSGIWNDYIANTNINNKQCTLSTISTSSSRLNINLFVILSRKMLLWLSW